MPLESVMRSQLRAVARAWWLLALVGALSIGAGVIVLAEPAISLVTLAVVTGVFLLMDGGLELAWSFYDAVENRGMTALFGVVTAIAGVILIRHPIRSIVAIALLVGLWLIIAGFLRLMRAFSARDRDLWAGLLGLLELIVGIVIVASPGIGVTTLALFIGISLIARGIGLCLVAWSVRAIGHLVERGRSGAAPVPG